jgi:hypothetical protein
MQQQDRCSGTGAGTPLRGTGPMGSKATAPSPSWDTAGPAWSPTWGRPASGVRSTISRAATTAWAGRRKWNMTPSPSHLTGWPSWGSETRSTRSASDTRSRKANDSRPAAIASPTPSSDSPARRQASASRTRRTSPRP